MKEPLPVTVILILVACGLISHLIGHCIIKMSKSNQRVHGFRICTESKKPFLPWQCLDHHTCTQSYRQYLLTDFRVSLCTAFTEFYCGDISEMPTSGRLKSGDFFFCTSPPHPPPPPTCCKMDPGLPSFCKHP